MRLLSTRIFFLISLSGFILASLGSAISDNFLSMTLFRGLQGFFGGAMIPIMVANIYIIFKPKDVPIILTIAATVGVSSVALGPILGGVLTELLDWRWMFLYNVPVGIIIFVLGYIFIDLEKRDKTLLSKIDYIGILLLATSLIALLIFLEEGDRRDWFSSNFIILIFTIFSLCLVFFIKHELTIKNPVIELNIFIKKNFIIGSIICIILAINLYPPIFLIPILITKMHNIDPIDIGLIVSTMGVGMMITGPISGRLLAIYGEKTIVILGSFITGLATYMQSYITADYVFYDFLPSQLLKGIGTQLIFMGSQYICLSKLHTNKVPNAAAMYNLILRLTAGVSIAVSSNYFIKFKKQFFSQISKNYSIETLTLNAIEKDKINSKFLDNLLLLYERESFILAFNKISYLSFYTSLVPLALLLIIAIKKNYSNKGTF